MAEAEAYITGKMVDFITKTKPGDIPEEVLHIGCRQIIDTLACTLLGYSDEGPKIMRNFAAKEGAKPVSLILGGRQRTSPHMAALVNGITAHSLDFDDGITGGHPSVVTVPAVLAVAEETGSSGLDTLAAYCIGTEAFAQVGKIMGSDNQNHYRRGWHDTCTSGVMCVAGTSYLYRLTPNQAACALGLAASHGSGLKKNFGTMTKPFHAGHAAYAGVLSASLAKEGFTASQAILDSPIGYFDLMAERKYDASSIDDIGKNWVATNFGFSVKRYPCCYHTHRAADAILNDMTGLPKPEEIESIEVHVPEGDAATLIYELPQTGLEGKFSTQYVVAAALLDGCLKINTFTDEMVQRKAHQALMSKIKKITYPSRLVGQDPQTVIIRTTSGDQIKRVCEHPWGYATKPLRDDQIADKYRDCAYASNLLTEKAIEDSLQLLWNLHNLRDIRSLIQVYTEGLLE